MREFLQNPGSLFVAATLLPLLSFVLILLTFAAPNLFEKNADAYEKLLSSLKKI